MQRKEIKHMEHNRDDEGEEHMDWEKASQHTVVCAATGTTKRDVVRAIAQGAETVADVAAATGACGECCAENLQGILDVYLTALRVMRSGCG
jgi:NAD(P)H-nitrite reductase large subunit